MNGTKPRIQGFMIPVNELDFQTVLDSSTSNICDSSSEAIIGAPWWSCENIELTALLMQSRRESARL